MLKIRKNKLPAAAIFAIAVISLFLPSAACMAYTPTDMTKKALMQALSECYAGDGLTSEFANVGAYKGRDSLYSKKVSSELPLPTGKAFHDINDSDLSCEDVIKGYSGLGGSIKDVFTYMGHSAPGSGANNVGSWLEKYAGYKKTETLSASGKCVKFNFSYTVGAWTNSQATTTTKTTDQICVDKIENGVIKGAPQIKQDGGWNRDHGPTAPYSNTKMDAFRVDSNTGNFTFNKGFTGSGNSIQSNAVSIKANGEKWNDFVANIVKEIPGSTMIFTVQASRNGPSKSSTYAGKDEIESGDAGGATGSYKIDKQTSPKTAIKSLYGDKDLNSNGVPKVTDEEKVHVYMYYFEKLFGAKVDCSVSDDVASGNGYDGPIKWFESGKTEVTKKCYVKSHGNHDKVNGIDNSGMFQHGNLGYDNLLKYFKDLNITKLTDAAGTNPTDPNDDPNDDSDDDDENDENEACYAGAGAMGWLLCPAIMSLEGLMDQVYSFVEEHFLKIRSDSIFNGAGSGQFRTNGVHEAWSKLQAIANIVFIIFFIIVLFSQITGVGISNYGIKKMLPKLIVTAVLINLSYIICAVLVDLSNVLGVGLRGLLESGLGIQAAQGAGAGATVSGFLVAGSITLTTIIIAVCINPGLVVTLLLFLGSAAIAVLFLWLILVVREVVVILGIVLSPVAFACSALPNTESLFKKWMKIMQAMLLLYPLCSLVVGGGQFAGRILASVGQSNAELGWTFNLAAMVAQVVPFFFIPSLLKGTLAGLGTLGAKLAQGQRTLNANTMGRIRNSDRYKDFQMRSRAGMKADGTLSKRGELMNRGPLKAFNRGTNAARASYLGRKGQIDRMKKYSDKDYLAAARVAEDDRVYNEEVANALTLFDSQGATSADLLAAVSKDGGARSIAAIQKLAQKKDFNGIQQALATIDVAGLSPNELNKLGQTLAAMQDTDVLAGLYGKKLLKGDKYSYADYAKGKAKDKNGNSIVQKDLRNVDGAKLGRLDDNVYDSNSTFDYSQILRDNMSSDQMASLVSSTGDLNSKNLDKVNEHIIGKKIADEVSSGVRAEDSVFSGASGAQVSGISESTIDAINGNGGDAQKIFASGISEINSPKNAAIRVNMNSNAKTKLGVRETPTVLGHGTYALNSDPNNRVHLTQLDNGKYVDDGGFEVDITKYNKV